MYYFIDSKDQSVTAYPDLGKAARAAIAKLNETIQPGDDPVKAARTLLNDRGIITNLSGAFDSIAASDDTAAQELAADFRDATNAFFEHKK
jgi:hypothetical protein